MPRSLDKLIGRLLQKKGLKALALILAVMTWMYIRDATSFEEEIRDIPLEVLLPEGWAIQERSVNNVSVVVRGSQADIRALDGSQFRVQADARVKDSPVSPTVILRLDRANVSSPRAVRVLYVDPPEVALTLDRESEKIVPVRLEQVGQPPDGYDVEKVVITPAEVKVHGPERRLARVEFVRTAPIEMEGRLRSFQLTRPLITPGDNWQARMEVDKVRVEFTIVERTTRKAFTNVPVRVLIPTGRTPRLTLDPPVVNVLVQGRADVISNLVASAIHAYVDFAVTNLPADRADGLSVDLPVEVAGVGGITVIAVEPPVLRAVADPGGP